MAPAQRLDLGDLIRAAERNRDEVAAARRQSDRETRAVLRRQFDQTTDPERRQELRLLLDGRRTVTDLLRDPDSGAVAVVDAPDAAAIEAALDGRGWTLDTILVTHHHEDHVAGVDRRRADGPLEADESAVKDDEFTGRERRLFAELVLGEGVLDELQLKLRADLVVGVGAAGLVVAERLAGDRLAGRDLADVDIDLRERERGGIRVHLVDEGPDGRGGADNAARIIAGTARSMGVTSDEI